MVIRSAILPSHFLRWLILAVTLSGCGTLSGLHEIVNVKTPADPVLVKLDSEPNFFAPDFIRMRRGRTHEIELVDPKSKLTLAKGEITCEPRWVTSGLCNGLLALASPPLGLAALAIDVLDGAAFDCRSVLPLPKITERVPKPRPRLCPTYLIAPPGHADFAVSERLAAVWIQAKSRELGFCGHFVSPEVSTRVFNYLNITNLNAATFTKLNRSQANILGYESKADHLVILRDEVRQGVPQLEAEVIDLHSLERRPDPAVKLEPQLAKTILQKDRNFWLLYSFSLVPNTIMYGTSRSQRFMSDTATGDPVTATHEHGMLPRVITSLALGTLDHPMGFDEWDASLRFYPTLDVNFWSVEAKTPSHPDPVRYQTIFINFPYNAELSVYTPIGTIGVAVSAGPMPTWTYADKPRLQLLWTGTREVSWTVFTSRDIFIQLVYDERFASKPIAANGVSVQHWTDVSLRLGYFTDVFGRIVQAITKPIDGWTQGGR